MNIFRKMMDDFIERNLEKYTRKDENGTDQYYVPEIDEWVYRFSKNVVKRSGLTQRTWYNKYILGEDENFRPKCALASCNNTVKNFKGTKYGYPKYCCLKHAREDEETKPERIQSLKEALSTPEVMEKKSRSLKKAFSKPEYKRMLSKRTSDAWKDDEYRERNLCKIPRSKNCVSKISIEFFNKVSEIFKLFGFSDIYYGDKGKEYRVKVIGEDGKMTYRYLDFFCKNLNLIIEFQGDYWHSVEKIILPNGKNRDFIRMKQIYDSMSKEFKELFLINVYEREYRTCGDQLLEEITNILSHCLQFGSLEDYGSPKIINLNKVMKEYSDNNKESTDDNEEIRP